MKLLFLYGILLKRFKLPLTKTLNFINILNMKKEMTLRRNNVFRQWEIAGEKRYPILDKHNQPTFNDDGSPKEEVEKI